MIEVKQPKLVVVEGGKGQDPIDFLKRLSSKIEESPHSPQSEAFIRRLGALRGESNEAA